MIYHQKLYFYQKLSFVIYKVRKKFWTKLIKSSIVFPNVLSEELFNSNWFNELLLDCILFDNILPPTTDNIGTNQGWP